MTMGIQSGRSTVQNGDLVIEIRAACELRNPLQPGEWIPCVPRHVLEGVSLHGIPVPRGERLSRACPSGLRIVHGEH